jgi:hypothetical protein
VTKPDAASVFFRLLKTPIDAKGETLAAQIAALNGSPGPESGEGAGSALSAVEGVRANTFTLDSAEFSQIPGSPFAYWVNNSIRQLFTKLPSIAESGISAQHGASTKNDFRFLRLWWEVHPNTVGQGLRWVPFAKGGEYSPYYADVYLLVNWENDAQEIHDYLVDRYSYLKGNTSWVLHPENTYFRPGLTWPRRTQKGLNLRAMPSGCIFADKGPVVFIADDSPDGLLALLAVMNSLPFQMLVELQMAFGSYEVGVIQRTPIPPLTHHVSRFTLATLAREAHDLQRDRDRSDETTHAFCLPGLVPSGAKDLQQRAGSLLEASLALEAGEQARQQRLAAIQTEIDDLVFDLYSLTEADRALVWAEMGQPETLNLESGGTSEAEADEGDEAEATPPEDLPVSVHNLLMWCVGVAFGRWDVRMALDPSLLPALQGPFDPLPGCAPGALVGTNGLPPATANDVAPEAWLHTRRNVLDLPSPIEDPIPHVQYPQVAWDGILVDDPTHPSDIVTRVRGVLRLLWDDRADAVEGEACDILGFSALRDYFRDPRQGFFAFHVKRYSKSRRKAPIYWLLQSEKRNYAIWLYYHRLTPATLFAAGRDYADAKVALEQARLAELRSGLESLSGGARRNREREIERQQRLVAEVTDFRNRLDAVALLKLPPDLNDGVLISIAPLWELVPWKEAQRMWEALVAGSYTWSSMAQQMQERGLVEKWDR